MEITLSKEETLLKIQANQNDPIIFQTFFCPQCQEFILANGLFSATEQHFPGHTLAWVPAVDEPTPGRAVMAIEPWLRAALLSEARRHDLAQMAPSSNSLCWALILDPEEREEWFDYLSLYLDSLADAWLDALNGLDSVYFRADEIWLKPRPATYFSWRDDEETE